MELVGEVIALGQNEYRGYNGGVLNHFQVNAVHGEGRAFLRAADRPYGIIQTFSNHSSSSVAAGADAMDPTHLLTADAFEEYFGGLEEDDGILHINHHIYPRIVTTAALGWRRLGVPIWVRLFFVGGRISLCGSEAGGNWIRHGVVREQRRGPVADGTCAVSDGWGCSAGTRALGGGSEYASMRRRPVAA